MATMCRRSLFASGVFLASVISLSAAAFNKPGAGQWSSGAAYLWPGSTAIADAPREGRSLRILSPDGSWVALVRDTDFELIRSINPQGPSVSSETVSSLAEVLWSPDSKALAVTQSDGGWVGGWSVVVYQVEAGTLRKIEVSKQATAEFNRRRVPRQRSCEVEDGNFGAATWVRGSSRLLIIAEAPPHSSCCDMGRLRGYLVSVPGGNVVARYTEKQLLARWRTALGERFRPAR